MAADDLEAGIGCTILVLGAVIGLVCLFMFGCTDEQAARRVLDIDGFKVEKITGWQPAKCSYKGDWYATGFEGTKNGKPVSGAVCGGLWIKSWTIRID